MNPQINERINKNEQTNEWTDKNQQLWEKQWIKIFLWNSRIIFYTFRLHKQKNKQMNKWTDEWVNEQINEGLWKQKIS